MVARSRVRRKPLPTPRATAPDLGVTYEVLATETVDEFWERIGLRWPDPADYAPEVYVSPADMFAALTGHRPDLWHDYISYREWQDQQPQLEASVETTQAITATVVQPSVADRYTALAPENIVVIHGVVVDPEEPS